MYSAEKSSQVWSRILKSPSWCCFHVTCHPGCREAWFLCCLVLSSCWRKLEEMPGEMPLKTCQAVTPPWRGSPAAKHAAESGLDVGRDARHSGTRSWRETARGGLFLLSPCTLLGLLWLGAELQPQSVPGGCACQSLLTPHLCCGLLLTTVTVL